jgi:hypothetical protein
MSKIQEFITAWNTAVDAEIATAQSQIDAYLAARQTAIALTDPFVLKIPVAQKEDPEYGRLLIPGFDATTLGQIFEWTYPIDGEIVTNQNGYRDDKRGLIFMFDDEKTDTRIYIDGYTYGTMSYLSDQYFLALKSREDLDKPLREGTSKFKSLESYKKLKNLGGKVWFDNWMRSLYSVISGTKISVSKLKASEYSDIFMRIEDVMSDNFLKGYYHQGTRFKIDGINASAENSKYFQAVLEAGDGFFPTQNSGTQSGTQSQGSGDYKLEVINPLSDNEKKISGKIVFIEDGQYLIANSTLNGLPNPWTNPVTNTVVPNNTGIITYNANKSTAGKSSLSSDIIINLQNIVQSTYGLTIYLRSTPQDTPTELPPPEADVPLGSTASVESATASATASQVLPLQEFIFNVELQDIFSNTDFGNLFIIGKEDTIVFDDDQVDYSEYTEEDFTGEEEIQIDLPAVELSFDMADARINGTSDNVPTSGNYESSARIVPSKLNAKMTFVQVTEAVISNLEGGYFHPDMTKDGRVKDSRYSTSGETMFGLDRKQGDTTSSAAKEFWSTIDKSGARSKWRWNHMPKEPLYGQLVKHAAGVIEPKFNSSLNSHCPDKNIQALIKSDGRLMFNVIYAQWNGPGWIKGLLKVIVQEYNNGKKDAESLLKASVVERVRGGHRMYNLGTGKTLGSRSASLIAQGGQKIAKLTGVQVA